MIGKASSGRPKGKRAACAFGALAVLALSATAPGPIHAETRPVQTDTGQLKIAYQTDRDGGRLVLEFARQVDYVVERADPYTFIRFSQPLSGDLEPAQRGLSRYVAELRVAGGGRVLVFRVAGQSRVTHHRRGNAIVVTWLGRGRVDSAVAEKTPEPKPKGADTPAKAPEPKSTEKPAPPRAETPPAPAKPEPPREEAKRPDSQPSKPGPNGSQPQGAAPDAPARPAVGPALSVTNDGTETRIAMAWPEPIGAAVFRHGDKVWMVFSRRQAFDLAPHQNRLGAGVEKLSRIEHAEATVLAASIRAGMGAHVTRERNVWTIVLKRDQPGAAVNDLKLAIARGTNEQVSVALAGAETPIRLADPDSGSTLFAVPSRVVAAANGERRFVTFRLFPAVQGAVVEGLADGLAVGAEDNQVVIRRHGGLLLSGGPQFDAPAQGQ